jgi:hypothetical protein
VFISTSEIVNASRPLVVAASMSSKNYHTQHVKHILLLWDHDQGCNNQSLPKNVVVCNSPITTATTVEASGKMKRFQTTKFGSNTQVPHTSKWQRESSHVA